MFDNGNSQAVGSLRISEEVIGTIAKKAAAEAEGVASLVQPAGGKKGILSRSSRSVRIEMNDDVAVIDMYMNVRYGANIPSVAQAVQKNVKDAVQSMTGITVSKVNLHICDVVFED